MFRVRWSARAAQDFDDLISYISDENPQNAKLVRARILRSLENLESFTLGTPAQLGAWKLYIPKTSYFVVFRREDDGEIGIRAFIHASRDWAQLDWDSL